MSSRIETFDSYGDLTRGLNKRLPRMSRELDKLIIGLPEDALVTAAKEFGKTPPPTAGSNRSTAEQWSGIYDKSLAITGYCRATMNTKTQFPNF